MDEIFDSIGKIATVISNRFTTCAYAILYSGIFSGFCVVIMWVYLLRTGGEQGSDFLGTVLLATFGSMVLLTIFAPIFWWPLMALVEYFMLGRIWTKKGYLSILAMITLFIAVYAFVGMKPDMHLGYMANFAMVFWVVTFGFSYSILSYPSFVKVSVLEAKEKGRYHDDR